MSKSAGVIALTLFAAVFLLLNRAAYQGYFQDDDLDTLAWAPRAGAMNFIEGIVTPKFFTNNFRPVGHLYYHLAGRFFQFGFPEYVAVLQFFHLLNVCLLWMLARQMRAPPAAAGLACIFFGFHMALFDAFWKPMYAFDVLCATFCLLAILFWTQRRWILSFAAFWLAYKAKELAVMLPLALACYELWLGKRQWRPLVPFFLASLSFGLQALVLNPNKDDAYTFRFTFDALRKTGMYYASRVFLIPYAGFLAPLAAIPGRNRRAWFGLAMSAILFFPMLFLPGRVFSAYCYVPFTGLALALSGLAEEIGPVPVAVLLLLFAPLDLHELRARRNVTLAHDRDVRAWVAALQSFARTTPRVNAVVWDGSIPGFQLWGISGAIHDVFPDSNPEIVSSKAPAEPALLAAGPVAYIVWNEGLHFSSVTLHTPGTPDTSFIDFSRAPPVWQLGDGWFDSEGAYRWTALAANARLFRPEGATGFTIRVLIGTERLQTVGPTTLRISLDGRPLEPRSFDRAGWQEARWQIPDAPSGTVQMSLQAGPPFHPAAGGRVLGIAVGAFGFVSESASPR